MHGREFTRAEMYQISHQKSDGSYVNDKARELHVRLLMFHEICVNYCIPLFKCIFIVYLCLNASLCNAGKIAK